MFKSYLVLASFIIVITCQSLPNSCDSPIYCYGDLLKTVQLSRIFPDSKSFVDLKLKYSQNETLQNFEKFKEEVGDITPTQDQVRQFVEDNFEEGQELGNWTLPDFKPNPSFVERICNESVKTFTLELIQKWPELARYVKDEVKNSPEQYSLISVPNGFIIPGGRFREYYYWDSYWIIDGLLVNEMTETAKGMIENFLSLVDRFGFIPNGGRVYYLQRSQPPLLTAMADIYYKKTKDHIWLRKNIDTLAKELKYWDKQTITIRDGLRHYKIAHYDAPSAGPRPESYREDILTAAYFTEESKQQEVFIDLKSGAESGWDFSSRWIFDANGGTEANLTFIQTRRVVPVDLNAYLCGAYKSMKEMYASLGNYKEAIHWRNRYTESQKSIQRFLWNKKDGIWYDYDLELKTHRKKFYPSSVTPLWSKCFETSDAKRLGKKVLAYLQREGVLDYLGGIPTSLDQTGEQWDFPNAWPPLQDIVVRGLENSRHGPARKEAEILAQRWIHSNILGYDETGVMFEKYDAVVPGQNGGGGEYEIQAGFGWTNGVALRFIHDYSVCKVR